MSWKRKAVDRANAVLRRSAGLEITRAGQPKRPAASRKPQFPLAAVPPEERLLSQPVFILSSIRSGSTLLRMLLGSHSELHAPHELHLRNIGVTLRTRNTVASMAAIGLDQEGLEHLLWDRLLARQLRLSGKKVLVNKTPSDAFIWRRISTCWPDARYVFLLRHPLSVVRSRQAANPHQPMETQIARTMSYMKAVEEARAALPGLTVRYEDLTADPEAVTREICAFLGVGWEPGMLEYGGDEDMRRGLGDWSDRIKSGAVQPPRPLPAADEIPDELMPLCRAWGYLPAERG